jgi:DNA-binding transcriptional ArsR family regulator
MYALLKEEEVSPADLAQRIGAPLANTSYHVKVLARAGLIEQTRTEPVRGVLQHFYRASADLPCEAMNVRLRPEEVAELTQRIRDLVGEYNEDWSGETVSVIVHTAPLA